MRGMFELEVELVVQVELGVRETAMFVVALGLGDEGRVRDGDLELFVDPWSSLGI